MFDKLYSIVSDNEEKNDMPLVLFGIFFNTAGDWLSVECCGIPSNSDYLIDDDDLKEYIENANVDYNDFVTAVEKLYMENRYYIANEHHIPLRPQPEDGYTWSEVIARLKRELQECVDLFGGSPEDHKDAFTVLNSKFREVPGAMDDI